MDVRILQLLVERDGKTVQRRFGRTVVRNVAYRDDGEPGSDGDEKGWLTGVLLQQCKE